MIIVLEGINGVGKSTYAIAIRKRLGAPIVRPFRPSPDTHWDQHEGEVGAALRELGVPINTFVDDLYVADMIRMLNPPHAVLDRGMPSSVAYGRLKDEEWTKSGVDWTIGYWEECLLDAGHRPGRSVVLAYLFASFDETKRRCEGRWHPSKTEWSKLKATYDKVINRSRLPVIAINTELSDVDSGVDKILAYGNAR